LLELVQRGFHLLVLGNVSFEAILVIEEELDSLALDDQRVEGGQDMNLFPRRIGNGIGCPDDARKRVKYYSLHCHFILLVIASDTIEIFEKT
jgi:hypothetical protein